MWWWIACQPSPPSAPASTAETGRPASTADTAPIGESGAAGHTGGALTGIAEALAGRCADPTPWEPRIPGVDLHRVTLNGAGVACNDGSPPVLYVRPASDPAHADDWVLLAEGGSHCQDWETCAERWCGEDAYDAAKMSTAWDGPTRAGTGIQARSERNAFSGWNQAFLRYCSSDMWLGREAAAVVEGDPSFLAPFQGHAIWTADLEALIAGVHSDDGVAAPGPMGAARTVVLAGASSGGYGAAEHVDALRHRLPGARVQLVVDSAFGPAPEVVDPAQAQALADDARERWLVVGPLWDGWVDDRCAADHPGDELWRCSDTETLLRSYASDDLVVHADLEDPVSFEHTAWLSDPAAYAAAIEATLRLHASLRPGGSYHGAACGEHTVIDDNLHFRLMTVEDALAPAGPFSLQDELVGALQGARTVAVDTSEAAGSVCR